MFNKNLFRTILVLLAVTLVTGVFVVKNKSPLFTATAAPAETKITASDGAAWDYFGYSVSISGDYAVIGAYRDDGRGSAYVFERSGGIWNQVAKLTASDGAADDCFGFSVSISGNYAVIGAPWDDDRGTSSGSAYIFEKPLGGWTDMTQTAKLTASDGAEIDIFSYSVSISGDYAAISAYGDDSFRGSAYVFERSGGIWNQVAKLTASDRAASDYFGYSVSISGDNVVIGANGDDDMGEDSGSAYIYVKPGGGWANMTQTAKLTASDGAISDRFGQSVSISGDNVVIGAYIDDDMGSDSGSAYIYVKPGGGWATTSTYTAKLTAGDGTLNDQFSSSVSISGDNVVIGANGDDDMGSDSGSAYVFVKPGGGWVTTSTYRSKLTASDGAASDYFGSSVSTSGDNVVIGAYGNDDMGSDSGSAYIYTGFACTDVTADFTDANFLTCISATLGTPGLVCQEDAAALTALTCNSQSISGIAGAENLTSLVHFYASDNSISDLSPLSGITTLQTLFLDNNNISDISSLVGLTDLRQIWLANSSISDISVLSGMPNLYQLVLHGNNVSDISPLSGLTDMQYLYMNENDVTDLSPLSALMSLEILDLNNNNISDLSVLSDKTSLTELTLNGNDLSDISDLSGLTNLIDLVLSRNNITDPSALSAMINLTNLELVNNNISDITSLASGNLDLAGFASGNTIDLSDNPLCDSGDFDEITSLESNGARVSYDPLVCGDGNAATGCNEQCDDGNLVNGDGCSAICQGEYYGCYMTFVTPPIPISNFMCDAGCQTLGYASGWSPNSLSCMCYISNSRVCDAVCNALETAYPASGLTCGFINCGNGIVEPDGVWPAREECDDGNLVNGDGCSSTCTIEIGCGDEGKYIAPDGAADNRFGYSVAISGDYAIAGAYNNTNANGAMAGAAYIYEKNGTGWTYNDKLIASDGTANDLFGYSVAIDSDYAAISAPFDNFQQGKVYFFHRIGDNWIEEDNVTVPPAGMWNRFGNFLSLSGNYAVIGTAGHQIAYVYERTGTDWNQIIQLTASDAAPDDGFAGSVSIDGDYMIIGAASDDDSGNQSGSAYIFYNDPILGWIEQNKITASDAAANDGFGMPASIYGDYVIVGAAGNDDSGESSGSAYIFHRSGTTWTEEGKLTASDAAADDMFGTAVSITGDFAVLGAWRNDDAGRSSGSAYIFYRNGSSWREIEKLTADDAAMDDYFGYAVSASDDFTIIGANYDSNANGDGAGSIYAYQLCAPLPVCGNNIIESGEQCDDGNIIGGDGCSATCTTEGGGSSNPSAPACGVQPTAMNLPEVIPVSQIGGKPSVGISWNKLDVQEINADQKIHLLFDYFGQIISPTIGENGIKLENVFAKYMYDKIMDDAELKASFTSKLDTALKAGFDLAKCDCIGDIAEAVVNTVRSMRNVSSIKAKTDDLILGFVNDVLNLERTLKETGQNAKTPFTNFFNRNFANAALEGLIVDVYRDGRLIYTEENPNNTSYTDNNIPLNDTGRVKYYSYHLVSRNNCGQAWGSVGKAKIDPIVPAGTAIDTTLDLSIRIKDGYSQLFIDRLREVFNGNSQGTTTIMEQIYEHEDYLAMVNTCSSAQSEFMANKTSDLALEYIIKCYASGNPVLMAKIQERKDDIVQPLIKLINLNEGGSGLESLINMFINSVIQNLLNEIETENIVKESIGSLGLNTQTLLLRERMEDFTQDEKEKIKLLNENLFEGAGHVANLIIEKYDDKNVLLDSYRVRTDVFGEAKGISIGKLSSGKEYTIKIRLFDERFVLPKVVKLTINNAEPTPEGKYKTTVAMNFTKHFRYGDFNEDDTIDLDDIVAWGEVLSGKVPGDGEQYGMFDMWKFGNLDGLAGINLSDALTLQENWGGLKELTLEEGQMSLSDLLGMFGFTVISAFQGELESGVNVPAWIDIVQTDCRS